MAKILQSYTQALYPPYCQELMPPPMLRLDKITRIVTVSDGSISAILHSTAIVPLPLATLKVRDEG